ncbi:hypothetical protein MWN33_13470 [Starkeya koreensis]|uniref:Twin-arginine translocation signal domain-containing protein n=1 Tax=Ancylobacter koreensis TaxID=266121 RepID=A0ABT0DP31_9HYPH|nr:hypothetical protein [Ancylobacter koreensis]MCK0209041.1 hypothetical protein [Ancylobacter koreensis]
MTDETMTRRDLATLAAGGALAVAFATLPALPASAYQGNMERAVSDLYAALASLRESTPNKGGHRERAIELVRQAIAETQAGIDFADEHGGAGPGGPP